MRTGQKNHRRRCCQNAQHRHMRSRRHGCALGAGAGRGLAPAAIGAANTATAASIAIDFLNIHCLHHRICSHPMTRSTEAVPSVARFLFPFCSARHWRKPRLATLPRAQFRVDHDADVVRTLSAIRKGELAKSAIAALRTKGEFAAIAQRSVSFRVGPVVFARKNLWHNEAKMYCGFISVRVASASSPSGSWSLDQGMDKDV